MNVFDTVTKLFQDLDATVEFANLTHATYQRAKGEPVTTFGADDQDAVARNIAGLYAADAAAQLLVLQKYGADGLTATHYVDALEGLIGDKLGKTSWATAELAANLAWRSGQPFRGLDRLQRSINKSFTSLTAQERESDRDKIKDGAKFILVYLQKQHAAAA